MQTDNPLKQIAMELYQMSWLQKRIVMSRFSKQDAQLVAIELKKLKALKLRNLEDVQLYEKSEVSSNYQGAEYYKRLGFSKVMSEKLNKFCKANYKMSDSESQPLVEIVARFVDEKNSGAA